ncbi:unnamed protein product [Callosobruchus maculatus]|uniref:Cilia-and flagella-associated protein 96 n=1 Tax=Callosobruchus maculatus TaxID=64391 RepID=A0A653BQ09_CALMS|nr:unnamed protein product [Callosobruchus maculatus]VEN37585.1 unnamed protein product [Callosobruchus maculatus]VEN37586.1 unnamed protein product [Callosobruchus maculatus]VEN37587.1 unnamed protein product [Callosobruchus maculatus]VEN37589.1 unnamed protein product [Callosobruchus maculatus]
MPAKFEDLGNQFGKPDMERLGLFSEMPYMNGKGYVSPFPKPKLEKGLNLMAGGPKLKTGKQDCYFDKDPFKRIFEGEAIKGRGRKPPPPKYKNVSQMPFMPPAGPKLHSTPGDYYGCFSGNIEAFSNKRRPKPPFKPSGRNFVAGPEKMGGSGYADICINPYPEHANERWGTKPKYKEYGRILNGPFVSSHYPTAYFGPDPYKDPENAKPGPVYVPPKYKQLPALPPGMIMPTGPAKWEGGCKAGTFDKFPEYSHNKYYTPYEVMNPKKKVPPRYGPFFPQSTGEKTLFTCSVVNENVRFRCNTTTMKTFEPTYTKYLLN